jgi:hypothetical protein
MKSAWRSQKKLTFTVTMNNRRLPAYKPTGHVVAVYRVSVLSIIALTVFALLVSWWMKPQLWNVLLVVAPFWILIILLRLRHKVVFTTDAFCVTPMMGRTVTIPLQQIKSAELAGSRMDEDGRQLRIEFWDGSDFSLSVSVRKLNEVVELLNKAAGNGRVV